MSEWVFLNFIKYKTNIGMHIFQYYDIMTKNRSLLGYDGHSALLKFLDEYTVQKIQSWCPCVRGICLLECICMCVLKRMRD